MPTRSDMKKYTDSDINKLGNAIVYIAEHVPSLSKTKLLKLLYLMEEYSVRRFHTPFLGVPYEVWQAGPVIKDVFIDLSENPVLLDGFINRTVKDGKTFIEAATQFNDDEFSDNDMLVMDDILRKHGQKTAKELVRLTHKKDSLWHKTADRHNLLAAFSEKRMNNSDCEIDFSEELTGCAKEFYTEQMEFLNLSRNYSE